MAIDSRDDRFSLLSLALPFGRVFPNPDGAIANEDKQHYAYLYRGITLLAVTLLAMERAMSRRVFGRVFGRVNYRQEIEQEQQQPVYVWRR